MERPVQLCHHQQAVVQGTGPTHTEWKELGLKLGLTPGNHPHGSQQTHSSCRTCDTRKALLPKHKARYILPSLGFHGQYLVPRFPTPWSALFTFMGAASPQAYHGLHGISF